MVERSQRHRRLLKIGVPPESGPEGRISLHLRGGERERWVAASAESFRCVCGHCLINTLESWYFVKQPTTALSGIYHRLGSMARVFPLQRNVATVGVVRRSVYPPELMTPSYYADGSCMVSSENIVRKRT